MLLACSPLHDLDAASRGSAGGWGKGGAGSSLGGSSSGGNAGNGASLELLCKDGALNGAETDVDCGGGSCDTCARGFICTRHSDCALNSCVNRRCQAQHCTDTLLSIGETDVDCGGSECPRCGVHQACKSSQDCTSNSCVSGTCVPSSCDNAEIDGYETDLNCGGVICPACRIGRQCGVGGDCVSGICLSGVCSTIACVNGVRDADEEGIDCGGVCPIACAPTCSEVSCTSGGASGMGGAAGAPAQSYGGMGTSNGGVLGSGGVNVAGGNLGAGGASAAGGATASGSGGTLGQGGSTAAGGTTSAADPTCTGCARLSVPLATATDKANFVIILPAVKDFSAATMTLRVYLQAGSGGQLKGYIQHSGSPDYLQLFQYAPVELKSLGSGWHDIVWNIAAQTSSYDKTIVGRIGVQITGQGSTNFTNPTVAYLDSISVSGVTVGPWAFDQSSSIYASPAVSAGANVMFNNFGDNPVSGSSVNWYSK